MNAEQFVQFVDAEQADRAAARQTVQQQYKDGISSLMESTFRDQAEIQVKEEPDYNEKITMAFRD